MALVYLLVIFSSAFSYLITKGYYMDGNNNSGSNNIDKIDVECDHAELIALYYRMELIALAQILVYEHGVKEA